MSRLKFLLLFHYATLVLPSDSKAIDQICRLHSRNSFSVSSFSSKNISPNDGKLTIFGCFVCLFFLWTNQSEAKKCATKVHVKKTALGKDNGAKKSENANDTKQITVGT
ncbi:Snake venom serine protease [Trichinella pseudospiralis]